jgi:hypothetical protein
MSSHQPHLLQDLRLALAVLYSLPSTVTHRGARPSSSQAHEFLMQFQSRNIFRKLNSHAKSQRGKQIDGVEPQQGSPTLGAADFGSTWLCCLALLSSLISPHRHQAHVNYAEALFAAQTIVHRLRRIKLTEAIDLEFEPPLLSIPPQPQQLLEVYTKWMEQFDPTIYQVLKQYHPHSEDEDCIKGEVTMMTLTTIMYCLTLTHYHEISSIRPLLSTLASALAVTTARLRFTSISMPDPSPNTRPVVTMILQSLTMVRQLVSTTTTQPLEQQSLAYAHVLYTCMTAVPGAILAGSGNEGGAHARMSMDPRCYTAVTTEVRTQGITQVWESFADLPSPEDDHLVIFLHMCEEWAKYAPLPLEFVQRSIALVEMAFTGAAGAHPNQYQLAAGKAAMCYWIAIMEGGSWNADQVLAASLIQKTEASQQPHKKRTSSKSKKRQKEVLEERATANQLVLAQNEVQHRGDIASQTTMRTWHSFRILLSKELATVADIDDEVQGDGPVGGITACANACLPHLLRQPSQGKESMDLFVSIGHAIQEICSSPSRMVRSFASESLYTLHEVLVDVLSSGHSLADEMEVIVVNHFFQVGPFRYMELSTQFGF